MTRTKRRGRTSRRILAIVIAVGVALGMAELVARIFVPAPRYIRNMPFDPHLGFHLAPDAEMTFKDDLGEFEWRINASHFRGPDLPSPGSKDPGRTRILFFGDSFLNAALVREERLMSRVLADKMTAAGKPAEAFILCCDDYGTAQELMLLERHGASLQPDVVVLALFPTNDLVNNTIELAGKTNISGGDYIRPYLVPDGDGFARRFVYPWRARLRAWSRLYQTLDYQLLSIGVLRPWPPELSVPERLEQGLAPYEYMEVFRSHPKGSTWEIAWERTEQLLRTFRAEVDRLGAQLVVMVIPAPLQVEKDGSYTRQDATTRVYAGKPLDEILDFNAPERRLAEFFAKEKIVFRSLLDPYRRAVDPNAPSLYANEGHLAWRGHEVAAQVIANCLLGSDATDQGNGPPKTMAPVSTMLDPTKGSRWLDFRRDAHRRQLARGFEDWSAESGWLVADFANFALPLVEGGDLVLRGSLPDDRPVPVTVSVQVPWRTHEWTLTDRGPFELRMPNPLTQEAAAKLASLGYFDLVIRSKGYKRGDPDDIRSFLGFLWEAGIDAK